MTDTTRSGSLTVPIESKEASGAWAEMIRPGDELHPSARDYVRYNGIATAMREAKVIPGHVAEYVEFAGKCMDDIYFPASDTKQTGSQQTSQRPAQADLSATYTSILESKLVYPKLPDRGQDEAILLPADIIQAMADAIIKNVNNLLPEMGLETYQTLGTTPVADSVVAAERQLWYAEIHNWIIQALQDIRLNPLAIQELTEIMGMRIVRATARPGASVGIKVPESIVAPMSQATMKSFHQAGTKSARATGITAAKEIVNASAMRKEELAIAFPQIHSSTPLDQYPTRSELLRLRKKLVEVKFGHVMDTHIIDTYQGINTDASTGVDAKGQPIARSPWWYGASISYPTPTLSVQAVGALANGILASNLPCMRLRFHVKPSNVAGTTKMSLYQYGITMKTLVDALWREIEGAREWLIIPSPLSFGLLDIYIDARRARVFMESMDGGKVSGTYNNMDDHDAIQLAYSRLVKIINETVIQGVHRVSGLGVNTRSFWSIVESVTNPYREYPYLWRIHWRRQSIATTPLKPSHMLRMLETVGIYKIINQDVPDLNPPESTWVVMASVSDMVGTRDPMIGVDNLSAAGEKGPVKIDDDVYLYRLNIPSSIDRVENVAVLAWYTLYAKYAEAMETKQDPRTSSRPMTFDAKTTESKGDVAAGAERGDEKKHRPGALMVGTSRVREGFTSFHVKVHPQEVLNRLQKVTGKVAEATDMKFNKRFQSIPERIRSRHFMVMDVRKTTETADAAKSAKVQTRPGYDLARLPYIDAQYLSFNNVWPNFFLYGLPQAKDMFMAEVDGLGQAMASSPDPRHVELMCNFMMSAGAPTPYSLAGAKAHSSNFVTVIAMNRPLKGIAAAAAMGSKSGTGDISAALITGQEAPVGLGQTPKYDLAYWHERKAEARAKAAEEKERAARAEGKGDVKAVVQTGLGLGGTAPTPAVAPDVFNIVGLDDEPAEIQYQLQYSAKAVERGKLQVDARR